MSALMNGIQSMKLDDGSFLYFWYANNKGRGSNNCTIIPMSSVCHAGLPSAPLP
jgi:hypothetical protein